MKTLEMQFADKKFYEQVEDFRRTCDEVGIRGHTDSPARYEILAEESAELAQAALKLARKLREENPTPVPINQLENDFLEAVADVLVCLNLLGFDLHHEWVETTMVYKAKRLLRRLRKAGKRSF